MKLFVSYPYKKDKTFLTERAKKYLEERFDVVYSEFDRNLTAEEFTELIKDCDAVLTGWGQIKIDYDMLKNSKVKIIAHLGGSVGGLIGEGIYENGIKVLSGNELYAESVAEGALSYILMGLRKIPTFLNEVRNGGWRLDEKGIYSAGLFDKTVGIISLGAISRYLIPMLKVFRVKIKIYSGHKIDEEYLKKYDAEQVSLEEIFSTCDVVSLHSAQNEKTLGMIGKEHFDLLSDGALFVNTARGRIVREDEMIEALKENRFRAVLDVYHEEPMEKDNPLRTLENVYAVPHQGGPTVDRREYVTMRLADNILKIANGEKAELEISRSTADRMTANP